MRRDLVKLRTGSARSYLPVMDVANVPTKPRSLQRAKRERSDLFRE